VWSTASRAAVERHQEPDARTQIVRTLVARGATLPVSALAGLLTARVVVSAVGAQGYGLVMLVATIPLLIPVTDLGVGAAVTGSFAEGHAAAQIHAVLVGSIRVLLLVAAAFVTVGVAGAVLGLWAPLLGLPGGALSEWSVAGCLALFGVAVPFGLGARVLLGVGENHVAVALQMLVAPFVLVVSTIGLALGAPVWLYACAPSAGLVALGVVTCRIAVARCQVDLGGAARDALRKGVAGARIRHLAGPMAVVSAALPVAYQSDRLVLSHVSTVTELAVYSAGAALFAPALAVVASSGQSLWPVFARTRGSRPRQALRAQLVKATWAFAGMGVIGGLILAVAGPAVATWLVHGELAVSLGVMASFGVLLVVHATYYPTGMLLMDAPGLRLQAATSVAMAAVNVVLSVFLAKQLGAAGPIIASAVAIVLCMAVPGAIVSARRLRVGAPTTAAPA
jgi:O-antigen/teichoic acid export membrane protein